MKVIKDLQEFRSYRASLGLASTVGFVPTMGALHDGHMALVEESLKECDFTVVSIYVNPTQFNSSEDLENYPSTLDKDLELLEDIGCDCVLLPTYQQLYPLNYRYKVTESMESQKLCGTARPGHFDGVLSVVMKLLNLVKASKAFFGEKDYQQYELVRDMAHSFFMETEIVPVETQREETGLALSSRNFRLSPERREYAANFSTALKGSKSIDEVKAELESKGFVVDYLEEFGGRRYGAVFLDDVRLIDNVPI